MNKKRINDQQAAQLHVAGLGDAELLVGLARLLAAGHEAEVGADVAGVRKVRGVFDGDVHQDTTLSAMAQPGCEWEMRPGLTTSAVTSPLIQNA